MIKLFAMLASGVALGACAQLPAPQLPAGDRSISFAANGGIRDWYSNNEQSIYLRDRTGRWYYAEFLGVCPNLHAAQTINYQTDAGGSFDRFSAVTTEYARCQVRSVTLAPPPRLRDGSLARP